MGKFYAVKKGRIPGIYTTWDECQKQTSGFSGAIFHSFTNEDDALNYMQNDNLNNTSSNLFKEGDDLILPYAFVDGSYNPSTKVYGYGGFIKYLDDYGICNQEILSGSGNDSGLAVMRNITGELLGCMIAIEKALELGLSSINIYYDYLGIEMWGNKKWSSSKPFVLDYIKFIEDSRTRIDINFIKVEAHTGIPGNEIADKLAKKAVGL